MVKWILICSGRDVKKMKGRSNKQIIEHEESGEAIEKWSDFTRKEWC